jgi:hypothetical protein
VGAAALGFFALAALAACESSSSDAAKRDISSLPEESIQSALTSAPVDPNITTLLSGTELTAPLSPQAGWLAYELSLPAGRTDLTVSGVRTNGKPLDTVAWILGPRNANGGYTVPAVAFNDDAASPPATPGTVSSFLTATIAQAGRYLLLISTYENWASYPAIVTSGTVKVRVTCPRGSDAVSCQQPASPVGGSCIDTSGCAAGLLCDAGTCVQDFVWLYTAPRVCNTPWDAATPPAGTALTGELAKLDGYLRANSITLVEVGYLWPQNVQYTCQYCGCWRGEYIIVKARAADRARLTASFGFADLNVPVLGYAPKQCSSNPWQAGIVNIAAVTPRQEATQVTAWAANTVGAAVNLAGFSYPTTAVATCSACTCARGDRLVVAPRDSLSSNRLSQSGFVNAAPQ